MGNGESADHWPLAAAVVVCFVWGPDEVHGTQRAGPDWDLLQFNIQLRRQMGQTDVFVGRNTRIRLRGWGRSGTRRRRRGSLELWCGSHWGWNNWRQILLLVESGRARGLQIISHNGSTRQDSHLTEHKTVSTTNAFFTHKERFSCRYLLWRLRVAEVIPLRYAWYNETGDVRR